MSIQESNIQKEITKGRNTYKVSKLPIRDSSIGIGPRRLLEERFLRMSNSYNDGYKNHCNKYRMKYIIEAMT